MKSTFEKMGGTYTLGADGIYYPESGWFRKGEHKHVFAYGIETACDKNGWIIDFTVNPGNEHDSRK